MATLDLQPDDNIRRTRIGVWDIYEYPQPEFLYQTISSIRWRYTQITEIAQTIPYIARMFKDIFSIRRARMLLPAFLAVEVLESLLPAISLWYSGKLLHLTQTVTRCMHSRRVPSQIRPTPHHYPLENMRQAVL
ncbi:hypothetical protein BDR07DRAFT_764227 [Suillus spraguei]|nr:hypothetical protein BDR07DRAFT_764227 [Suillus spraguei]